MASESAQREREEALKLYVELRRGLPKKWQDRFIRFAMLVTGLPLRAVDAALAEREQTAHPPPRVGERGGGAPPGGFSSK